MPQKERYITILPGSMINHGMHEDDNPLIARETIRAKVIGRKRHSALPIEIEGLELEAPLYFHQPGPGDRPPKKKSA